MIFWACMSSVVQYYKNFTGGWQWKGHQKIAENVTRSTSNVSPYRFSKLAPRSPPLMMSGISSLCYNQNSDLLEEARELLRHHDTLRSSGYVAVAKRLAQVRKTRNQNRGVGRNPAPCIHFRPG